MGNTIQVHSYESPCGCLKLGSFGDKLCLCDWSAGSHRGHVDKRLIRMLRADFKEEMSPVIERACKELDEYIAGRRVAFGVPLMFIGTEFQMAVWNKLLEIRYGETVSYGEVARRLGTPSSVRAVANANGANAISIFVPCHRVTGHDGSLTGYAGGLEAKRYLLTLESHHASLFCTDGWR